MLPGGIKMALEMYNPGKGGMESAHEAIPQALTGWRKMEKAITGFCI